MKPTSQLERVVLGIDPGFDRMGWAVGNIRQRKLTVIKSGQVQTNSSQELFERYAVVQTFLRKIIEKYKPTHAAVEELFFSVNKKTALRVAEVRGVIIGELLSQGLQIFEYHPQTIKLCITGHGKADKLAMAKQLQLELGVNPKLPDDELDAIAIALTHTLTHGVS